MVSILILGEGSLAVGIGHILVVEEDSLAVGIGHILVVEAGSLAVGIGHILVVEEDIAVLYMIDLGGMFVEDM